MFRPLIEAIRVESESKEEGIGNVVDRILPRRAKRKAAFKADDKRRQANAARDAENLRQAVARIKTRH